MYIISKFEIKNAKSVIQIRGRKIGKIYHKPKDQGKRFKSDVTAKWRTFECRAEIRLIRPRWMGH